MAFKERRMTNTAQAKTTNRTAEGATPDGAASPSPTVDGVVTNGWTPVLAVVVDGARRVLQVADWQGGTGTKPGVGLYVGLTGLTAVLADGVDVRGATGPAGAPGADGATGPAGPGVPPGGTTGQVLVKLSNADYDTGWATP